MARPHTIYYKKITPPKESCDSLVHDLFRIMGDWEFGLRALEKRSGCTRAAMKKWREGASPGLYNFRAALNAMGYDLRIVKCEDHTSDTSA